MYTDSVAYAQVPRVNNIALQLIAMPLAGAQGTVTARISGLPEALGEYSASLFVRLNGGTHLIGPLPTCAGATNTVTLVADADPAHAGSFLASFPDWFAGANAAMINSATGFSVAVYPSAYPIIGMPGQFGAPATCITDADALDAFPNSFPVLAFVSADRPLPASATSSPVPPPSPSGSPSTGNTASPSLQLTPGVIAGQGNATASEGPSSGGSSGATSHRSGAGVLAAVALSLVAALAGAAALL